MHSQTEEKSLEFGLLHIMGDSRIFRKFFEKAATSKEKLWAMHELQIAISAVSESSRFLGKVDQSACKLLV